MWTFLLTAALAQDSLDWVAPLLAPGAAREVPRDQVVPRACAWGNRTACEAADEVEDWMEPMPVDATLMAHVDTSTTVIIRPHLVMEIFGMPYEIAGIDIPVMLPEMNDSWIFETRTMNFDRPEPPVDPMDGGATEGGEDGGLDAGETYGDESGETGASLDELGSGEGCSCRADSRGGALGLLGLLLLPALRRRRR